MSAEYVSEIIAFFENKGIEVYVDGGWCVDALIKKQTREHEDIDITVPHKYTALIRYLLEEKGYTEVFRDDTWECNFVLGDSHGHLIDIHSYVFDETGKNVFGVAYEPKHLTGHGVINGYNVKCPSPEISLEFHTGYPIREKDIHDVKALCEKFNFDIPDDYKKFI